MVPWMGGALVTDGFGTFDFSSSQGNRELPMAAEKSCASNEAEQTPGLNSASARDRSALSQSMSSDDQEILVTRDGVDWDLGPMPAAMAADQTLDFGPSARRRPIVLACRATDSRAGRVVVRVVAQAETPSLRRGTFEP